MFEGKVAMVTGGGSGIGAALSAELVRRGARVLVTDVDGARAAGVAEGIGDGATARQLDVTDRAAVQAVVDGVAEEHGRIDLLFNNAGIAMGGPTDEVPASHFDRILDVNLGGVLNGVLAAYPRMVAQGAGHIVNTASLAGLSGPPMTVAYATSKHAVVGLSTTLRLEAAFEGVKVSVLCPGAVDTAILDTRTPADLPAPPYQELTTREFLNLIKQKPMPADRFARAALDGVARNRAVIIAPRSAKALWYLHRASPRAMEAVGRTLTKQVRTAIGR